MILTDRMKMMRSLALLGLSLDVHGSTHRGSCGDHYVESKSNFRQSSIEGRWYEIAKDKDFFDADQSC